MRILMGFAVLHDCERPNCLDLHGLKALNRLFSSRLLIAAAGVNIIDSSSAAFDRDKT